MWGVNGDVAQFPATDAVGDSITMPGAIGYLLERTAELNGIGNRTSVLIYTPDAGATSGGILIACSGGGVPCNFVTSLIGMV